VLRTAFATQPEVDGGYLHTCGLTRLGRILCWGYNAYGQATPPGGTFTTVSGGGAHNCGVRGDGTVACWGSNGNGQATPPAALPFSLF